LKLKLALSYVTVILCYGVRLT